MRVHTIIIVAAVTALSLSCVSEDPRKTVEQTRYDTLKKFQAMSYHRVGGQAKVDESLFILPNGGIKANSKMYGDAQGTLNEMQQLQLVSLFETWDDFKPEYPSPKPSGKPAMEEIQFGQKKVVVADDAENIPEELARVRARLSGILNDLVKK
ncbi:MAG: hypothetical protein ABSH20_09985 [Tepidisphaeraceae bacterium]|jgi:hypothetical protein